MLDKLKDLRHRRFCLEYACTGFKNQTEAAVKAGYNKNSARTQASRLLKKDDIQKAVNELHEQVAAKLKVDAVSVQNEMAIVGFSNIGDYLKFDANGVTIKDSESEIDPEALRAVSGVRMKRGADGQAEISLSLHNKGEALRNLATSLGLMKGETEPVEVHFNIFNGKREKES